MPPPPTASATTVQGNAPSTETPVVAVDDVTKVYQTEALRTEALRGVSFTIGAGERVAIMGPSGCGKTTLLNCLSGLEHPSGGTIRIAGEDIYALSDDARTEFRARRMGFVFQSFNLLPVLTAVENVELPLLVTGRRATDARPAALDALALVGLSARADHHPREMSGGEQQRVAVARSLVHSPPLVWADEPTGNLDSETSRDVMDLIVRLNEERGTTFVIVTHDASVASRCHRTIQMRSGRIDDGTDAEGSAGVGVAPNNAAARKTTTNRKTTTRAAGGKATPRRNPPTGA